MKRRTILRLIIAIFVILLLPTAAKWYWYWSNPKTSEVFAAQGEHILLTLPDRPVFSGDLKDANYVFDDKLGFFTLKIRVSNLGDYDDRPETSGGEISLSLEPWHLGHIRFPDTERARTLTPHANHTLETFALTITIIFLAYGVWYYKLRKKQLASLHQQIADLEAEVGRLRAEGQASK